MTLILTTNTPMPATMNLISASKRPFRHPVPPEALDYFCHPRHGHRYQHPAWSDDGQLYVCNGWVALRFFHFAPEFGGGPPAMVERLRALPWHAGTYEKPEAWRALDQVTLDIFKEGLFEPWHPQAGSYRADPCARINHGALVPLVSLQMISRLPRCEIYTAIDRGYPVPFRFNGGEGLIARLPAAAELLATPAVCHLFPHYTDRI
jgi:hypothetical protein